MSSTATNSAILAAAGSRKTEYVVDSALTVNGGRVLITTYTNENQRQIIQRIEQKVGFMPSNISVVGGLVPDSTVRQTLSAGKGRAIFGDQRIKFHREQEQVRQEIGEQILP